MRRYPIGGAVLAPGRQRLAGRLRDAGRPLGVVVLLVGCAIGGRGSPTATGPTEVTVATAAGDRLAFAPAQLTVPDQPLTMTFRNASTLPHNLVFTSGMTAGTRTIVEPGASEELALAPPGPGSYPFVCTIHEGMSGTLVVTRG